MPSSVAQRPTTSGRIAQAAGPCAPDVDVGQLCELAGDGLVAMFDTERQLFCFRLKQTRSGLIREGFSHRYSIIALLGLQQYQASRVRARFAAGGVLGGLLRDSAWLCNLGDLGLLLWLCAMASPERLEEVYFNFNVQGALSNFREARERRTMELAWFLAGLAHAGSVRGQKLPSLSKLALETYRLLMENQGARGPFGHLFRNGTLAGVARGHIGSFADQVYPIYALAKFAESFQVHAALAPAQKCADAICRGQGALGQWWWHYHSQTGRVLEHYPVYAVHQHGMAPMALFALTEATQIDFSEPVYRGLRWLAGENELTVDLRVASAGLVWRSMYHRSKARKYFGNALTFLGFAGNEPAGDLKINCECRPYELGWLLYAFASRASHQGEGRLQSINRSPKSLN
jgi:hypothetical protein